MAKAVAATALCALFAGCTSVDLSGAPTKSLGIGHIFERLPIAAKVGTFRDSTPERTLAPALLARATESFSLALRRTELFDRVVVGGGDRADVGLDAEIVAYRCTRSYAFIWCFYSALAVIAVPANLPLTIDEGEYEVKMRAFEPSSGQLLGTYQARFYAYSWRGAWSLFATWLDEPEQLFDKVDNDLIRAILDDYPKLRALAQRDGSAPRAAGRGGQDPLEPR